MQLWNSQSTPKMRSPICMKSVFGRGASPPGPPTRALPWTHWGPRRPPDPLPVVLPHCSGPSYAPESPPLTNLRGQPLLLDLRMLSFTTEMVI